MSILKSVGIIALTLILGIAAVELGAWLAVPGVQGVVSKAEARVGRPLTPVSVAGVSRRTVRRCAAGVYYC